MVSCAAYSRLHLDLERIGADNEAKTGVARKGGIIIWRGSACPACCSAACCSRQTDSSCLCRREPHDDYAQRVAGCRQGQVRPCPHLPRHLTQSGWLLRCAPGRYELPPEEIQKAADEVCKRMMEKKVLELGDIKAHKEAIYRDLIRAPCLPAVVWSAAGAQQEAVRPSMQPCCPPALPAAHEAWRNPCKHGHRSADGRDVLSTAAVTLASQPQ